ncbi:DUF748 domain-containing protein [Shewanella colwelliana]|uniref:DUF748 domain-containing protein n=1 Tax=Shewanella colwelliana TaxID=23 RepID=UPI0022B06BA5|nr:DUF748 domain-containing protein [Shewanella colwelliana]MCZ4336610.1 DUF748 domain-containing protein [Shewanella colwelliana]
MSVVSSPLSRLRQQYTQLPKYQRYIGISTLIYLMWTLLLGLLVPYIVQQQAPKQLSQMLNREVVLSDVAINPFTLAVSLDNFAIKEADGTPFVGFHQLSFEYQFWQSIFNWGYSATNIELNAPYAHIKRVISDEPLRFNFSDIIEHLANNNDTEAQAEDDAASAIPHFLFTDLAIVDANLNLIDDVTQGEVTYPSIQLNIAAFDSNTPLSTQVSNEPSSKVNRYDIGFVGRHGGLMQLKGQVQLTPFNVVGDISLQNIHLPQFWTFIADEFKVELDKGLLDFSTDYQLGFENQHLQATLNNGELDLKQLNVNHQQASILALDSFALKGINFDLANKSVVVDALTTNNLTLNAHLDKTGVNLEQLFVPKQMQIKNAQQPPPADEPPTQLATTPSAQTQPWNAILNQIKISDYKVNLTEQLLGGENLWKIGDISLSTGPINAALASPIDYQLALNVNQQGTLTSQGSIDPATQQIDSQITMANLALTQFQPYLSPYLNINLEDGLFSTQGQLQADASTNVSYQGALQVKQLLIKDTFKQQPLLKWQTLDINQLTFDKAANQLNIDQVTLSQPFSRILIAEDRSTNFQELMVQRPGTKPASKPEVNNDSAPLALSINNIAFNDGSTFFADNSLTPNFAASIEHLSGSIANLSSSSEQPASVDIQGKIDRYAPVSLKGQINPLLAQPFLDLALSFKHVELTSVNPYSGTYAGYYIDKGLLSLDLNYQLENNQLVGDNHLVVDQLQLGKPSDSSLATSLPITLAIALLQDRHGVIDLGLQVSGDLDEPSFSFGSIIATAFTNVITKAVTAPFSLLAGLLGSDDELDKVPFNAGESKLSDASQKLLDNLAKGLESRPMLTLSAKGAVDEIADSQALMTQALHQKLAHIAGVELNTLPANLTPSTYPTSGVLSDALKRLYQDELQLSATDVKSQILAEYEENPLTEDELATRWHIALYNYCHAAQTLSDDALGVLAQQRALSVKAYLVDNANVGAERIFVLDSRVDVDTSANQALLTLSAN